MSIVSALWQWLFKNQQAQQDDEDAAWLSMHAQADENDGY